MGIKLQGSVFPKNINLKIGVCYPVFYTTGIEVIDFCGKKLWDFLGNFTDLSPIDSVGNVYAYISDTDTLYKIDKNGKEVWSIVLGYSNNLWQMDINDTQAVYTVNNYEDVKKINNDGSLAWTVAASSFNGSHSYSVHYDGGYVYVGGYANLYRIDDNTGTVTTFNSQFNQAVNGIDADLNYVYAMDTSGILKKIDKSGNVIFSLNHNFTIGNLTVSDTSIYVYDRDNEIYYQFDKADGSIVNTYGPVGNIGYLYTSFDGTTYRLNSDLSALEEIASIPAYSIRYK